VNSIANTLTISGTSSVVQLDAWDWEDAAVRTDDGIHLNWPAAYDRQGWWAEPGETEQGKKDEHAERIAALRDLFRKAKAYSGHRAPEKVDLRMEAMRGLFDGKRTLYMHANAAREIIADLRRFIPFDVEDDVDFSRTYLQMNVNEPLFLNEVGSEPWRPETITEMPGRVMKSFLPERAKLPGLPGTGVA
jgi:hypothetical protein